VNQPLYLLPSLGRHLAFPLLFTAVRPIVEALVRQVVCPIL